jgi:hypothetical protein
MPNYYNNNNTNGNSYPIATATPVAPLPASVAAVALVTDDITKKTKKHFDSVLKSKQERTSQSRQESNKVLKDQGFTGGLIQSINRSNDAFPLRIWVVDNSGSMNTADGHRLYPLPNNSVKLLDCSRWAEIQDTVTYHARMAAALQAPTSFRLLNPTYGTEMFGIAERGPEQIPYDLDNAIATIQQVSPNGVTPLSDRVREIGVTVESMKHELFAKGQKVAIVLATDGLPSDRYGRSSNIQRNEFTQALRSLEGLPVWVVIRLCTDDDDVVDFYNNIDNELELSLDVLDDFVAEAKEVYEHNKWLNYALPLHRMREMGFYHKLFDLIDERSLTRDELRDFFYLLYGADALDGLPDPQVDWDRFLDRIAAVTNAEELQWNPITKRMAPWVDIRKLDRKFGNNFTCFSFF